MFNRIVRQLVKSGFGDITVKIRNEEITSIKSILCNGSELFNKLINDEQFEGTLELNENISVNGYYLLEKWLSGCCIEINDETVVDLLLISLFYEENLINMKCKEYIYYHMNEKILLDFLNFISFIDINQLSMYYWLTDSIICQKGYKYIYSDIIYDLSINAIYYILNSKTIIIDEENDILKRIIKYNEIEIKNNRNVEKDIKILYESVNWNKIDMKSMEAKEGKILQNNNINIFNCMSNNINNRIYLRIIY